MEDMLFYELINPSAMGQCIQYYIHEPPPTAVLPPTLLLQRHF